MLVGHFPLTGSGSNDRYEIYGNFFYENPTEALFQGEGNLVLHDNLFVNRSGDAVHVQRHNDRPRTVVIFHNTVLASGNGISVTGADPDSLQKIQGNAVFAGRPIVGPGQADNIVGSLSDAEGRLVAPGAPLGRLDLHPQPGRLAGPAIDLRAFDRYEDGTRDFDGRPRKGINRGAYETDGSVGASPLSLESKPAGR